MGNEKKGKTMYATLNSWIQDEAIRFSVDAPDTFNAAVDQVIAALDPSVRLLGLGEALHGGEDLLIMRNRLFQRLVERHGYGVIAVESSFPRGRIVNQYILGNGPKSYDAIKDSGFSHGFGQLEANRELIEWMRQYNADPAHPVKVHFYGFDSPTEMMNTDSPRVVLHFVLDYLASVDGQDNQQHRDRINALVGTDTPWENPAAMMDHTQAVGLSAEATALRIETEDLISELQVRRPELVAKGDPDHYLEAIQYASMARQLLNYHAGLARHSATRTADLLGVRDGMMADCLVRTTVREKDRGKVLAFAHNRHLQRGKSQWQLGPDLLEWWPAGAHLAAMLGARYAVIGSGLRVSADNGIGEPEAGTLEDMLIKEPGAGMFIPTHQGNGLPDAEIAALPTRSGSVKNPMYFPLAPESFTDFDWLLVLHSSTYSRGGPVLPSMLRH
jgi:erythromycin esterase